VILNWLPHLARCMTGGALDFSASARRHMILNPLAAIRAFL
jgi:hypothetical protein